MNNDPLIATLKKLNPENDSHWTTDGLPRLDVLSQALKREVTRDELNASVPGFSRVTAAEFGAAEAADDASTGDAPPLPPSANLPPAPEQATTPADAPTLDADSEADVNARADALRDAISHHAAEAQRHQQLRDDAQNQLAALTVVARSDSDNLPIADFLASQNAERARRAELALSLKATGIDLGAIAKAIGAAPVDAARAAMPNKMRLHG